MTQNISLKVKDLLQKWQAYVTTHTDFEVKLKECQLWIGQKSQKLSKALEMSMGTQSEVDQVSILTYFFVAGASAMFVDK